jgi:hypothetical protein
VPAIDDLFEGANDLIEEAKACLPIIKEAIGRFTSSDNWVGKTDKDLKTGEYTLKVVFSEPIDKRVKMQTFNVCSYLRSALDHACYASAVAIKGGEPKHTKFLFADTELALVALTGDRSCKDMHPDIISFIQSQKPYEAGNKPIWALNKLRNKSTHRILVPTTANAAGFGIHNGSISGSLSNISEWKPLRRELAFCKLSPESLFNMQITPTIIVNFEMALGFAGEPAHESLEKLVSEVECIVMGIKAETIRILANP